MIYCGTVLLIILGSFIIQEFMPIFTWAHASSLLLVHAVFYAASVTVPFGVMLLYALIAGFLWEARYHLPVSMETTVTQTGQIEMPFGFTIFIFGLMGTFIQGVRPFFRQGRWELPVLMVGLCTLGGLLLEYLVICFHRGGIRTSAEFWWKTVMISLFSTLIAPFLLLLLSRLALWTGYKIRMDGITRRYSYDGDIL